MNSPTHSLGKSLAGALLPPAVVSLVRRVRRARSSEKPEWEVVPEGWDYPKSHPEIRGWDVAGVAAAYRSRWEEFRASWESSVAIGPSPEAPEGAIFDLVFHNTIVCFAYTLALVSRGRSRLSVLDWGGGMGHYYVISRTLVPSVELEYHCKDLPKLVDEGKRLLGGEGVRFYSDETCLDRQYDFVFASTSLHYSEDWRRLLGRLVGSTGIGLFITRLPTVEKCSSFVFVQRPYQYGYATEYLGWCLNRGELLRETANLGLSLVREFTTGEAPAIVGASEVPLYRGFLFLRDRNSM